MNDFIDRYRAKFGNDPDPYGLAYYDGAFLMADAMRQAGLDPTALQKWLAAQKGWEGIGHVYSFDSKGNGVHDVVIVKPKAGSKTLELVKKSRVQLSLLATDSIGGLVADFFQLAINGFAIGGVYALAAMGFVIVYEATGVVNFAAGQFVMFGTFAGVAALVNAQLPWPVAYAVALLAMAAFGVLFFALVYCRSGSARR